MTYDKSAIGGKISILTTLVGVLVIFMGVAIDLPSGQTVRANVATTSVRVLNTPPTWVENAQENPGSSTSTPTNIGNAVTWKSVASDSSGDNYYLIICKNAVTPTPNPSAAPSCSGGVANQWAISASTVSNTQATAATTTVNVFPFLTEFNDWYAYICDGAAVNPACNVTAMTGNGTTSSPFVVNHPPTFTAFNVDSPKNPGQLITWSATADDSDSYQGADDDTVRLFVCRQQDFTGTDCGAGGTWASSTYSLTNPTASYTLPNPQPDGSFAAWGYIIDRHGTSTPVGGSQNTSAAAVVNNITPTIDSASVSLLDVDDVGDLTLSTMAGQTSGFEVRYTVSDQNSCSTTAAFGSEITYSLINVYRSSITQASCDQSTDYNPNNCYPDLVGNDYWAPTCVASSTSCLGTGDSDIEYRCTFPLWYVADPTDAGSQYPTDTWLASAQAADDDYATSSLVETTQTPPDLTSFLAYSISTTSIAYGGLQPGTDSTTLGASVLNRTNISAVGNVGLDQELYGSSMCPTYPTCSGTLDSTIFPYNQQHATSGVAYNFSNPVSGAYTLATTSGTEIEMNISKTKSTSTPNASTTYWGIRVPSTITLSGDYIGVNTLLGVKGESSAW
jgi:hypothetical protein